MKPKNKNGFMLVEIMVVIAIASVLVAIVVGAITVAKKRSVYVQLAQNMRDITAAIQAYSIKMGEFPPKGDLCTYGGGLITPSQTYWNKAVDSMTSAGVIDSATATSFYTDLWGNAYAYDDNYGQNYKGTIADTTTFCSVGPDHKLGDNGATGLGTGDDFCLNIKHEKVQLWYIP